MMSVYEEYIQKSSLFCYPLIGVRRKARFVPAETYMAYEGWYALNDCRFICYYDCCKEAGFEDFSEGNLKSSKLFEKVFSLSKTERMYIFNFSACRSDWQLILDGKYSCLSHDYKEAILDFHNSFKHEQHEMRRILYPKRFYRELSEFFNVSERILQEVVEVLDKPNLERESFSDQSLFEKKPLFAA